MTNRAIISTFRMPNKTGTGSDCRAQSAENSRWVEVPVPVLLGFLRATLAAWLLTWALPPAGAVAAEETAPEDDEAGFVSLFDGSSLDQWSLVGGQGPGYVIEDGILVCPADGGGNLFTKDEYSDFAFRFEFRLEPGGNNGVGIRAPLEGNAAYVGMEIQILDDYAEQYANLQPYQYHGSIYGVVPVQRGSLKPAGEWNSQEILCDGRQVKITLNGDVVVDANLDDVTDPEVLEAHPGLLRDSGHIGFLGHGSRVEFRNIRVKDLSAALD